MEQSEELRKYAKRLRNLVNENIVNEDKIKHLINEIHGNQNLFMDFRINNQVQNYIKETERLNEILDNYANELEERAWSYEATCAPPMLDSCIEFVFSNGIKEWWFQAYPIIEQIATITGAITGVSAVVVAPISLVKWIRGKLQEKKVKVNIAG